jgi:hypothetical protein
MLWRHAVHVLRQLHDEAQWRGIDEINRTYPDAPHFDFSGYIRRAGQLRQAVVVFNVYDIVADELCTSVNQAQC